MPLIIENIRRDTPHCKDKLFFNSAGSSLPPKQVSQAVIDYLMEEQQIGGYKLAELKEKNIRQFYDECARMLKCKPHNIAFTYNSTDAYARALSSIPFEKGDIIITTDNDYISNYTAFISLKKRFGIIINRIHSTTSGDLDLDHLQKLLYTSNPKLVSVSHVPTNTGLIQDIEGVGSLCQKQGVWYIVDACQSAGQIPLDVDKIQCDFLCSAGRKFLRGPRGTGFLYVSDRVLTEGLTPLSLDMRGARWTGIEELKLFDGARRFEMWEFNYANLIGLKEGIKYSNDLGWENIWQYNQDLSSYARAQLAEIDRVKIYDRGSQLSNIISLKKEGVDLEKMKYILDLHNVYYGVSTRANNLIDYQAKGVDWTIRIAPHIFNTKDEIKAICSVLEML